MSPMSNSLMHTMFWSALLVSNILVLATSLIANDNLPLVFLSSTIIGLSAFELRYNAEL